MYTLAFVPSQGWYIENAPLTHSYTPAIIQKQVNNFFDLIGASTTTIITSGTAGTGELLQEVSFIPVSNDSTLEISISFCVLCEGPGLPFEGSLFTGINLELDGEIINFGTCGAANIGDGTSMVTLKGVIINSQTIALPIQIWWGVLGMGTTSTILGAQFIVTIEESV